ncbi:hypothetical protein OSB04_019459 [Centaurea solstitialis]|uniref:CCHC-type domain-containing protein n=1 Tax=Centaurea solstitialis TaxID=347529 RepID=A0AA38T3U8_9ASTR|nr:hypothetical protein OSB04_019459 [Centaurea solstitialis]
MAKFRGNPQHFNRFRQGPQFVGGQSSQVGYQSRESFQRNDQGRSNNYQWRDSSGFNHQNNYNQGSYQDRGQGYTTTTSNSKGIRNTTITTTVTEVTPEVIREVVTIKGGTTNLVPTTTTTGPTIATTTSTATTKISNPMTEVTPPAANQNRNPARVPTCYNCRTPGHYASECKTKLKDSTYFEKKAAMMKKKELGKVLMDDEENWIQEPEDSDDEGPSAVQGHCLMADFEEPIISGSSNQSTEEEAEVTSYPNLSNLVELLESKILRLESNLQMERALVTRFRTESVVYKSCLEDLTLNFDRLELESGIRESNLENKLISLQRSHDEMKVVVRNSSASSNFFEERTKLFIKIDELEENNLKGGQSEHTLSLLTKKMTQHPFYQAKPGLGHVDNHVLDKAPAHLYNFNNMSASKPEPRSIRGHDNENYVMKTVTFTKIIDGKVVSFTTSPSNSSTNSPPSSPVATGPIFTPASDPENTFSNWDDIKARTPKVAMPPIDYANLNSSYDSREIDTYVDADVIQPLDASAVGN